MIKTVKDVIRYCNHFDKKVVIIFDGEESDANDVKCLENASFLSFEISNEMLKIFL